MINEKQMSLFLFYKNLVDITKKVNEKDKLLIYYIYYLKNI